MHPVLPLCLALLPIVTGRPCDTGNLRTHSWTQHTTNGRIRGHNFKTYILKPPKVSRFDCQAKCNKEELCVAIEWREDAKECVLSSAALTDSGVIFDKDERFVFYSHKCSVFSTPAPGSGTKTPTPAPGSGTTTTKASTTTTPHTTPPTTTPLPGNECQAGQAVVWYTYPNYQIHNKNDRTRVNKNVDECRRLCLENTPLMCKTIEFDPNSKKCILSWYPKPNDESVTVEAPTDEDSVLAFKGCEGDNSACPLSTKTVWVDKAHTKKNTASSPLAEAFTLTGVRNMQDCQKFCVNYEHFRCRSVEYTQRESQCKLSDLRSSDTGVPEEESLGTILSEKFCETGRGAAGSVGESDLLALRAEYIVLIGMGCVVILLVVIIVFVFCTSSRNQ